jgi:hypothetical protein
MPQCRGLVFLGKRDFGIVSLVSNDAGLLLVEFLLAPALQRRERLETGDAENPCRDRRTSLEGCCLPHTSRKTSPFTSSAVASLRTMRNTKR